MTAELLPLFNIVALPDTDWHKKFFQAAEELQHLVAGYQLSPGKALPHLTICQFRTSNAEKAMPVVGRYIGRGLFLRTGDTYIRPSREEGKFWAGYTIQHEPRLSPMQTEIVADLRRAALEVVTETDENYFPHFTIAKTTREPVSELKSAAVTHLIGKEIPCRVRLGVSDEDGQLLKILHGPT